MTPLDIDITGYVNLALVVVVLGCALSVQQHVKQIAADVRAIRLTRANDAGPLGPVERDGT